MRTSIALAASLLAASAHAQAPARACDSPQSHELDFWLGEWDLAYVQDGKPARSRNRITRILDGCAILEEFEGAPGVALVGRSVSMFDRRAARWKQVWVDNEGSWLDFEGGLENGRMVFSR
jgi:hypothetical protein